MNKHLILLMAWMILAVSCANTNAEQAGEDVPSSADSRKTYEATVSGAIQGAAGKSIYLEYLSSDKIINLDTAIADEEGHFSFEIELDHPGYYRIGLSQSNVCVLIIQPKDDIVLNADASNIYTTYEVERSKESQRLKDLNRLLTPRDSVNMLLQQAQMTQDQALFNQVVQVYDQTMLSVSNKVRAFIDADPASLSSLAAIQNLSMDDDFAYYLKVIDALTEKAAGNEFYESMRVQVQQQRKLAVGSPAPEISLPQPDGQILSLSDLKGQYVLIDFWASWCGPCRKENPNVVRVYNKYHEQGFEILGVSLDKNASAWLNAIEQDGLVWKHVSDLKYWNSAVVPEYQVKGIPLTFLIDPEGNIVAKNLRGPSLEQKLAEIFSK
jgi:peroxiredoxin